MIKKATVEDAAVIAQMAVKLWKSHTAEELTKDFEAIMEEQENAVFMLSSEERAIGFAQCSLRHDYVEGTDHSPVGYLEGIFIEESCRHQGYARRLTDACEAWVREKGCMEFASDCELGNTESLNFHLSMGFTEANRIICFTKKL